MMSLFQEITWWKKMIKLKKKSEILTKSMFDVIKKQ